MHEKETAKERLQLILKIDGLTESWKLALQNETPKFEFVFKSKEDALLYIKKELNPEIEKIKRKIGKTQNADISAKLITLRQKKSVLIAKFK